MIALGLKSKLQLAVSGCVPDSSACREQNLASSWAFKRETVNIRLSSSEQGDRHRKRENIWKLRCMGTGGVKGLIIFLFPSHCLLKTTKNSIYLRTFFSPSVKLNGRPTCHWVKWNHSWKMELARSHLLTARGRSEQQSLDQDLNFSHIQMCLDPGRWLTPISATSIPWLCVNGPIASHCTRCNHFHLGIILQENLLSWRPMCDAVLDEDSFLTLTRHQFSPGNRLVELYWWQLPYLQFSLLSQF